MTIRFTPLPTATVRALQAGGPDAHGQLPERALSDGAGTPCRHCLAHVPQGAGMPILAHRPFPAPQPYAETGPIFLCADPCAPGGGPDLSAILIAPDPLLRGYSADDRIVYGTGGVVPTPALAAQAADLLADPAVAYVHVRSARNGCYPCRIDRGQAG
ncbi:MAG: DUF1203 domain-containing protein [Rhodobacterales bacterium]|nr:DUF1203 domain-containing protein [Rhodobacterales bacterium]